MADEVLEPVPKKKSTAENLGASRRLDTTAKVEEVPLATGTTHRN